MYNGAMSHAVPNPHPHINQSRFKWELTSGRGQSYAPLEDWKNSIFPIEKCYFQYKYNYGK
jgi:hypothetical protein